MWCAVSVDARLNVNVALNRPSYQASTYSNAYGTYRAAYANDGNRGTHVVYGPCANTRSETNPWWAVDLSTIVRPQRQLHQQRKFLCV